MTLSSQKRKKEKKERVLYNVKGATVHVHGSFSRFSLSVSECLFYLWVQLIVS